MAIQNKRVVCFEGLDTEMISYIQKRSKRQTSSCHLSFVVMGTMIDIVMVSETLGFVRK